MARHYVKIPAFIKDYFPGGAPTNWREVILADATEEGSKLTVEILPPNEHGPRIAVHGDRYLFWFGQDVERYDTFFVMRMEPARDPRRQIVQYFGRFELWPGGDPAGFDSVASLFGVTDGPRPGPTEPDAADEAPQVGPSPLLLARLAQIGTTPCAPLRPQVAPSEMPALGQLIGQFRRYWRRYRLSGRVDVPPRIESVLQGSVTPSKFDQPEWRQLSGYFGFPALNVIALEEASTEQLSEALDGLGRLPLDPHTQAFLWTGMLPAFSGTDLRRELSASSEGLIRIAADGSLAEGAIEDGLLKSLREIALRDNDNAIEELVRGAEAAQDPLTFVARWTSTLEPAEVPHEPKLETVDAGEVSFVATGRDVEPGWLAAAAFPEGPLLRQIVDDIDDAVAEVRSRLDTEALESQLSGLEALTNLQQRIDAGLAALPSVEAARAIEKAARQALAEAVSRLGATETDQLLSQCHLSPAELTTVVSLLSERDDLVKAPSWVVWPDADPPFELTSATNLQLSVLLAEVERRHRWQKFVDYLRQIGEPETVKWMRPPIGGTSVESALQDWFEGTRSFLESLESSERASVLADGVSPTSMREVQQSQGELVGRLSASAGEWVQAQVQARSALERIGFVRSLSQKIDDFCRSTRLDASVITAEILSEFASAVPASEPPRVPIRVQHNWVGTAGSRATLVLVQEDPQRDLGYFDVPILLESDEARELTLRMRWSVKGDWRADWPSDYPAIEPEQLSIAKFQWKREGPTDSFQHTFRLRIPVRVSRDPRRRLEAGVTVEDARTGETLLQDAPLRWDALQHDPVPITVAWSTAGGVRDVEQHPIGPQGQASSLVDRLAAFSCIAVIAPRRFGKTTLIKYLAKAANERKMFALEPIVCTEYQLSGGIDYDALWSRVSTALYSEFDTGLPSGWSGALPPDAAFDAVRRAAHRKGYSAIVLLFDEAQLFFQVRSGNSVGSDLKTRLERSWCAARTDMCPVLFCFVGLPPLLQRGGADLMGLLMPIEANRMDEEELRPLISSKIPHLQTTRGLRLELAKTAGNLFTLRVLLNRLADRITRERRLWAGVDDLIDVCRSLARDLQEGREEAVAAYIRDVLNDSDDVNHWEPNITVPTAAAIADVRHAGTSLEDTLKRAADRLNEWSRASFADARNKLVYDLDVVRAHFARLKDKRVLDHAAEFESIFLEAWLAGLARRGSVDDAFREALFSGGQRRIKVPSVPPVHEKDRTRILRIEDPHGALAFRVRRLEDHRERQLFLDSVAMFDELRICVNRGEDGSAFVFRLEDIGLSASDVREAVQVYRWIEGEDLRSKVGHLGTLHVLDVGIKLSRALGLLHRRGILHRDVQPGNVVIDLSENASDELRPVLIDFGFARAVGLEMGTRLAGDYCAPEACADAPEWSRASDVFGLCSTLRALLDPISKDAVSVFEILKAGVESAPAARPSAEELGSALQAVAQRLETRQQRDELWTRIRSSLGQGIYNPDISSIANRHRTSLELLALNAYRNSEERHRVIADIANQYVERHTRTSLLSLATSTGSPEVSVLYALRVSHVHPDVILRQDHKEALRGFRAANATEQSRIVRQALTVISHQLNVPSLSSLLEPYA